MRTKEIKVGKLVVYKGPHYGLLKVVERTDDPNCFWARPVHGPGSNGHLLFYAREVKPLRLR